MRLADMTIGYGRKVVAAGLEVSLSEGEMTCLVGRNGVGKSTLVRTIAAFQSPLAGDILLPDGRSVSALGARERARLLGVVLTEKMEVENMTVWEMVAMGRSPYTGFFGRLTTADRDIVEEAIAMVGMEAFRERNIQTLSDGERQKIMIAKALAQQTPYIILDESTAFLDYPSKREMMQMLRRLCHEHSRTVLLSTHDVDIAIRCCDKLWYMAEAGGRTTLTVLPPQSTTISQLF